MTLEDQIKYAKSGTVALAIGAGIVAGAFHGVLVGFGSGIGAFGSLTLAIAIAIKDA